MYTGKYCQCALNDMLQSVNQLTLYNSGAAFTSRSTFVYSRRNLSGLTLILCSSSVVVLSSCSVQHWAANAYFWLTYEPTNQTLIVNTFLPSSSSSLSPSFFITHLIECRCKI